MSSLASSVDLNFSLFNTLLFPGLYFINFNPFLNPALSSPQNSQKAVCPYCKRSFGNSKGLNQHIGKVHTPTKNVPCKFCGKRFKHKNAVKFHIRQVHEKSTRVLCEVCGKTLYNKYVLAKHIEKFH